MPSVMTNLRFAFFRIFFSRSDMSLCLYTIFFAYDNLHASIMLAWFNSSLNIVSFFCVKMDIVPIICIIGYLLFALNQL